MDVKFNSSGSFGSKNLPYEKIAGDIRQQLKVVDPFKVAGSPMNALKANIQVVDNLPPDVLKTAVKEIYSKVLNNKPIPFKLSSAQVKETLKNFVCDTTELGEKYRATFNQAVVRSFDKIV